MTKDGKDIVTNVSSNPLPRATKSGKRLGYNPVPEAKPEDKRPPLPPPPPANKKKDQ